MSESDAIEGYVPFPDRPAGAFTGSQFCASVMQLPLGPAREERIKTELLAGNVPSFFRRGMAVPVASIGHTGVLFVLPDYLAIGADDDYVRVPMNPLTAQVVADAVGAVLPTRAMVNAIWDAAPIKRKYIGMAPGPEMTSTLYFQRHNEAIQNDLQTLADLQFQGPFDGIMAGHKKDVVLCKALETHVDRVAIYGWCKEIRPDGSWEIIQPLNPVSHDHHYADYSHGIRLVSNMMVVDGSSMRVDDVIRDEYLSSLLSDEGPLTLSRYPGT